MKASKRKNNPEPPDDLLTQAQAKPVPAVPKPVQPPVEPPTVMEFKTEFGEPWRIERFDALVAEFHLSPNLNADEETWQTVLRDFAFFAREPRHARQWLVVRRVFGIAPLIPKADTSPDDLRVWTRAEMEAEGFAVAAELDALRAMWSSHLGREASARQPETQSTAITVPKGELELDDKLLEKFQFNERIFRINCWDPIERKDVARPEAENKAERDWFIGRVKSWSKMLSNSVAGPIARDALMNDLYLRRLETEIATASSRDHDKLYDRKEKQAASYKENVERLQAMFPEMAVAGQVSFRGVVSDLIAGHRDYYAHADRRLVDKVFTTTEIEFALRTSHQVGARHRVTVNMAIVEAIHNFYNPDFRSQFKPSVLKKIEAGHRGAVAAAQEAMNEPVVDLEKGVLPGEGQDFEDFNDVNCPECDTRISSSAKKCPNCGMENPNDQPEKEKYV